MTATISAVARELRAARENLGFTREQLAEKINYSCGYIEKIETGKLPVTEGYIAAVTTVLAPGVDAGGLFSRLREDQRREVVPNWFRPWVEHEQEATEIRWYEPLLVPGLLQTEEYAQAVLRTDDPQQTEQMVAARMDRQSTLDRAAVSAIIEESVLTRKIGGAEVMQHQLVSLTESRAAIHVLPTGAETNRHLDGSFALAVLDGTEVGYVDSPARGFVLDDQAVVLAMRRRWETLLAEALPRGQSRTLILKAADRWNDD